MSKRVDRLGQKYGALTVIQISSTRSKQGQARWVCRCDCGIELTVDAAALRDGNSRTCGCSRVGERRALRGDLLPPGESGFRNLRYQYAHRSKQKGLQFTLTNDEFRQLTTSDCHYCGAAPAQVMKNGHQRTAFIHNGVDRKDNSQGYTVANSLPCCKVCNTAKSAMGYVEFVTWVQRVVANLQPLPLPED